MLILSMDGGHSDKLENDMKDIPDRITSIYLISALLIIILVSIRIEASGECVDLIDSEGESAGELCISDSIVFSEWDGKCPICKKEGLKSKVYVGGSMTTLVHCGNGHYDEDGIYHAPGKCNTTTTQYTCSNGHTFIKIY